MTWNKRGNALTSRPGAALRLAIIAAGLVVPALSMTAPHRESVALTVYNQNFALVKDVRSLDLQRGNPEVRLDDVAAQIDPTSVHFAALDHPDAVTVQEQNYQYDVANADRLLERYLNQTVTVRMKDGGGDRTGTLLSFDGGNLVIQDSKGASVLNRAEVRDVGLGEVPGGLVVKPTLFWRLASDRTGSERVEVSYLTNGINWHAEYVAVVNAQDTGLTMNGWVSLDNQSGATYDNAKLKLVAGDVHRVSPPQAPIPMDMMRKEALSAAQPQFTERGFFEYHIYTLEHPATVADKETKQLALFPSAAAAAKKVITYDGAQDGTKVAIRMEFENTKKNGLGMALPAGKVRVYKEDTDKALEFVGEDQIDHTPRDEKVRLFLGNAFDIVGERIQTNYKELSSRSHEESYSVEIRNHKDAAQEVTIIEHIYGDWKITDKSNEFVKKDSHTAEFPVTVPANGSVKVTYTVRITY
jgi:hypothetical protein